MKKETLITINKIMHKYHIALKQLYPNQERMLQDALETFFEKREVEMLTDPFTNLAYMMILCDCIDQEKRQKKAKVK